MASPGSRGRSRVSDLHLLLLAIVLVALAIRVVLAFDAPPARIGGDPAVYDQVGVSIADGNGWSRPARTGSGARAGRPTALHPPAWPLVLGATYALTDHEDHLDEAAALRRRPTSSRGVPRSRWRTRAGGRPGSSTPCWAPSPSGCSG